MKLKIKVKAKLIQLLIISFRKIKLTDIPLGKLKLTYYFFDFSA